MRWSRAAKAFQGSESGQPHRRHHGQPSRLSAELQNLSPPGLEHLVTTCLIKNPADRRQTAHDVLLQLEWIAGNHDGR